MHRDTRYLKTSKCACRLHENNFCKHITRTCIHTNTPTAYSKTRPTDRRTYIYFINVSPYVHQIKTYYNTQKRTNHSLWNYKPCISMRAPTLTETTHTLNIPLIIYWNFHQQTNEDKNSADQFHVVDFTIFRSLTGWVNSIMLQTKLLHATFFITFIFKRNCQINTTSE